MLNSIMVYIPPILVVIGFILAIKLGFFKFLMTIPEGLENFVESFKEHRKGYLQTLALLLTIANVFFLFDVQKANGEEAINFVELMANLLVAIAIPFIGYFNIIMAFEVGHDIIPGTQWDDWVGRFISVLVGLFILYVIHSIMFMRYDLAQTWGECGILPESMWGNKKNIWFLYSGLDYANTLKFTGIVCEYLIAIIIAVAPKQTKKNSVEIKSKPKTYKPPVVVKNKPEVKPIKKENDEKPNSKLETIKPNINSIIGNKIILKDIFDFSDSSDLKGKERLNAYKFNDDIKAIQDHKDYSHLSKEDKIKLIKKNIRELNLKESDSRYEAWNKVKDYILPD